MLRRTICKTIFYLALHFKKGGFTMKAKSFKKFLTNRKRYDRINELPMRMKATTKQSSLKTEQYVKP